MPDKPHRVMQRGSLVYWKSEERETLHMGVVVEMPKVSSAYSTARVYGEDGQEGILHPSHLNLFREDEYYWQIMGTDAGGSYRTIGTFHTEVGVYMRLLDGISRPASVQWRHKKGGDLIRQTPVDTWIRTYNALNAKMNEIAQESHPEPVSPYIVKSLVFVPKENPVTGKFEGYVSHEEKLGSREQVRAYLAGLQDTSMYVVYYYTDDGSLILEQNADDWLDQHYPGREKPLTMAEEARLMRVEASRIADTLEFLVTTVQEVIELLRPPVVHAFPDKRPGRVRIDGDGMWIEDENGLYRPVTPQEKVGWEEGVGGLDYYDWVKTQPWPDGATHATLDKYGACIWWAEKPKIDADVDLGWRGELCERYHDPAVPFRGVAWQMSLIAKPEDADGQEA